MTVADLSASLATAQRHDCRTTYVQTLVDLAAHDQRIVGVVNDSVGSSKLDAFKRAFPDRLINVGIAEQDMIGVAAGLANGGKIPFVSGASCFLTARAMEQIKADVAYSGHNIKLCAMSPGVAYGSLGPTHHSIEDIAWLRAIDNITVIVPADPIETASALRWAARHQGPVFVRISRMGVPDVHSHDYVFEAGRATELRAGTDATVIANGTVLWRSLIAADELAQDGVNIRVLAMPSVRPLDRAAVIRAASQTGAIVTVEESTTRGGLGGAVAEAVVTSCPVPMALLGIDRFAPTGSADFLLDYFGMSPDGIAQTIRQTIARRRSVGTQATSTDFVQNGSPIAPERLVEPDGQSSAHAAENGES